MANWLYYAHDRIPEVVKAAFANTTILERSLIARARATRITFRYCQKPTPRNMVGISKRRGDVARVM